MPTTQLWIETYGNINECLITEHVFVIESISGMRYLFVVYSIQVILAETLTGVQDDI